ncbi:MAG: MFS transporter [Clostridiales Family XIII bacterium]|jgi:MFS family permease|nr:MFS transporter [Clostridiales Family XIII bacterium]
MEQGQAGKEKTRIWTRDFTLATLAGLFSAMVFYITLTTLAMYAGRSFGTGAGLSGLVASIFILGGVAGRIFSGRYLDRVGRRRLVLIGGVLFFLISLTYLLPVGLGALLAIRLLHGVTFGIVHTALATIVVGFIPPKRRGEGIGFFSLNFVIATALGPFIGLSVIRHFSYTMLFALCAGSALLSLLFAVFIHIEKPVFTEEQLARLHARFSLRDIFETKALPLAFVIILLSLCYTGVTAFLDSYTTGLGMASVAPIFFVVYAAFILLIRPLAGKLLDRKGDNIVMLPTLLCFVCSLLLLSAAKTWPMFLFAAVLMALGYGNILNIGQAIAIKSVDVHRIGTATSTYFVFSDAGMGIGPLLMGAVCSRAGFPPMYRAEACIAAAALVLYCVLHGRFAGKVR